MNCHMLDAPLSTRQSHKSLNITIYLQGDYRKYSPINTKSKENAMDESVWTGIDKMGPVLTRWDRN